MDTVQRPWDALDSSAPRREISPSLPQQRLSPSPVSRLPSRTRQIILPSPVSTSKMQEKLLPGTQLVCR